jgi:hypothetical protein
MAALDARYPTLYDVASRTDPDGNIAKIAEIMSNTNEVLDDIVWKESNLQTGHRHTIRNGLPTPTWRKLYGGAAPDKSGTTQVTDTCGLLESYSNVDEEELRLSGNPAAFRTTEDMAFVESFAQEVAQTLFYGNEKTAPEEFTGLSPRYNSSSAENGVNIIRPGGTQPDNADNTSIWLAVWGDVSGFCIYPKGSRAGLSMEDLGKQLVVKSDGSQYRASVTQFKQYAGLAVRDWRYFVRISINQEDLLSSPTSGPDLIDCMAQAVDLIPNLNAGRPAFYANRTVLGYLRRQMMNKVSSSTLSIGEMTSPTGILRRPLMFSGIPVRRCDALLNTETGVA